MNAAVDRPVPSFRRLQLPYHRIISHVDSAQVPSPQAPLSTLRHRNVLGIAWSDIMVSEEVKGSSMVSRQRQRYTGDKGGEHRPRPTARWSAQVYLLGVILMALVTTVPAQEAGSGSGPGRVTDISVSRTPAAATVVQLTTAAPLGTQDFDLNKVSGGSPRALLKLRGIASPYTPASFEVDDDNLVRVRTGFHPEHTPPRAARGL